MYQPIARRRVLDHGSVAILNIAGPFHGGVDDTDPAVVARMSFDQMDSERPREADLKLAKYLMKHRHTTPFEMIQVWLLYELPIFVARQFVRHRTQSINEVSGRYVQLPEAWYVPEPEHVTTKSESNKQGRTSIQHPRAGDFCRRLDAVCRESYAEYDVALDEGIPPELARLFLHVNHYTKWVSRMDLHNLFHFLKLREDEHAQLEARQYAIAIADMLDQLLPHSMELYRRYR